VSAQKAHPRAVSAACKRILSTNWAVLSTNWCLFIVSHNENRMTKTGISLSIIWLLLVTAIVFANKAQATQLTLNEWGDFLAGATAPIAFLWLIIGYFQQGKELSLNTQALQNQMIELKRQADEIQQQTAINERLARAAENQADVIKRQDRQARMAQRREALLRSRTETIQESAS